MIIISIIYCLSESENENENEKENENENENESENENENESERSVYWIVVFGRLYDYWIAMEVIGLKLVVC